MLRAWVTGNADELATILEMSHKDYPDIYDRFFIQRNKTWIQEIEKLMKRHGNLLIILGAGHLVGQDSVIELLKRKDYKVKQL